MRNGLCALPQTDSGRVVQNDPVAARILGAIERFIGAQHDVLDRAARLGDGDPDTGGNRVQFARLGRKANGVNALAYVFGAFLRGCLILAARQEDSELFAPEPADKVCRSRFACQSL